MRTLLITLFTFLSLSCAVSAQALGVRLGGNSTNIQLKSGGITFTPDARINLQAGVFYDLPISERLVACAEANYFGRGYLIDVNSNGNTIYTEVQENYLDIGLLGKFNLIEDNAIGFYLGLGPVFSYALNGNVKLDGSETTITFDDGFSRTHFNLAMFIGTTFRERYFVEARYLLGLSSSIDTTPDDVTAIWNSIGLNMGARFFFNK